MNDATSTVAIRVLVVDDHWVVREGLRRYLTDEPGVMVIGEASKANQAGATGYLLKDTNGAELLRAIRAAADGKVQLSPEAATRLAKELRFPDQVERLTDRETEILKCVADGLSNKEIARRLSINEKTVKAHLNNVFGKLGVHSRTQAALHAIRTGIASLKSQ